MFEKRTGPIVVIAAGPLSQSEARALLASVNYDADVTWNENTYATKKDNLANLLVNVIFLCFIIIGFALVIGVAFGGVRILTKRLFPDRIFDRPQDVEFISLHLSETVSGPSEANVSSSIKAV
jgi:ABC-type antimicrobial peptide transport system permease subunit